MILVSVTIVALAVAYMVALGRLTIGLKGLIRRWQPHQPDRLPTVSVVVPARNEAACIRACVESILANDYPEELVDVRVVDDRSEDDTAEIVSDLSRESGRVQLIRLDALTEGGKRNAIQAGIATSTGEIILTTDGDSEVPRKWIHSMVSAFGRETQFVSGPVAYRVGSGWLDRLLGLELLGLVAVGAGAIALSRPSMCNGANIAFRRKSFENIGGYAGTEHLTSGDDELLMQKMARIHVGSVAFCPDPSAVVTTTAPENLRQLFLQRRRWASKAFHYPDKRITLLAVLVYLFNFALLAGTLALLWVHAIWPALLTAVVLKLVAEGWMFATVCRQFERDHLLPGMLAGQLFEIPYVVLAGAAGSAGRYRWKGRYVRR